MLKSISIRGVRVSIIKCCVFVFLALMPMLAARAQVNITMRQVDLAHTGVNSQETILTPANVGAAGSFGVLFAHALDAQAYAEPLYISNVKLADNSMHNVVYIATENNTIYAFDADSGTGTNANPLWSKSLLPAGTTSIPSSDIGSSNIFPTFGITATPVIDPVTRTLYTISYVRSASTPTTWAQYIHALDIATGAEKFGAPVQVNATFHGAGSPADGAVNGVYSFNPEWYFNRAALALYNGVLYACFAGHNDLPPYHGTVLGFDATTLALVKQFNATPNDTRGGIWMSGTGPAIDSAGNLYVSTGNGGFDQASSPSTTDTDWGDSVLKLPTSGAFDVSFSQPANWFTPNTYVALNDHDLDLASSGQLLLPDQSGGTHPHLLITGGKAGIMYVLDRDNMGGLNTTADNAVQELNLGLPLSCTPAYFNGFIYYATGTGVFSQRAVGFNPATGNYISLTGNDSTNTYDQWGEGVFITANGTANGLCWIVDPPAGRLDVYNAANVSGSPIYSYAVANSSAPRFSMGTVANGKAYFTAYNTANSRLGQLVVLGLLPTSLAPTIISTPPTASLIAGNPFNFTVAAAASPIPTFIVSGGALPTGLTLSSAGLISGTPAALGTFSGTITATNGAGVDAKQDFSITVTPPSLITAVSQQVHGSNGTFGLALNLSGTGPATIEPRLGSPTGSYSLVLTFNGPVTSVASATLAAPAVGTVQTPVINGAAVTIRLTNVGNGQRLNLQLTGIQPGATTASVPFNILWGDVNGDGKVNILDMGQIRVKGSTINKSNFYLDVNCDGSIGVSDISQVRLQSGSALP